MSEVTTAAAWIVGLALVAMLATGWRKTARAAAHPTRRAWAPSQIGTDVQEVEAALYRPARWWRRAWSVVAGGALAVWLGAVVATLLGFGVAYAVIRLTELLKR